jgi:cytidine deaminase
MSKLSQDKADTQLANEFRLSLSKPSQSSFRVLALLFYTTYDEKGSISSSSRLPPWVSQTTRDGRKFIVGANDEPGYMGGSICAERSAMVQLRFVPSFRITKLVICTDSKDPIAPGMLCREFLAGHDSVPWDLNIISTGCICIKCQRQDEELFLKSNHHRCVDGSTEHTLPTLETTLEKLYPYPSPYTRLNSSQSVSLGESYFEHSKKMQVKSLDDNSKNLLELAMQEARSNVSENHPIFFGAAVTFEDGTIVTSHQSSALEYGCSLDAVSQLAPRLKESKSPPKLLVQVDQYGICHSPFAPARAFLSENGFGDCQLLIHDVPKHNVTNVEDWSFRLISASDLAMNAPDWTISTDRPTKKYKVTKT